MAVRREVNRQLTGDPDQLFIARFLERLSAPAERALSVGCGTGELERGVANLGAARQVEGVDVSAASLAEARRQAEVEGLADRVTYHQASAGDWLGRCAPGSYGLIFFHGSLHHIEDLEVVLAGAARALAGASPGLLYVDEYVGPSRDEWRDEHLAAARRLFERIPKRLRRTPAVWPPIAMEDPTEMVRSSEIPELLRERFEVLEEHPYGGPALLPLVSAIRGSALEHPEVAPVLREALTADPALSFYSIFVARPRAMKKPTGP
ncbi:MAG: class I SAM-dependent methyltransferase [Acidobacteriota bacterium]